MIGGWADFGEGTVVTLCGTEEVITVDESKAIAKTVDSLLKRSQ